MLAQGSASPVALSDPMHPRKPVLLLGSALASRRSGDMIQWFPYSCCILGLGHQRDPDNAGPGSERGPRQGLQLA